MKTPETIPPARNPAAGSRPFFGPKLIALCALLGLLFVAGVAGVFHFNARIAEEQTEHEEVAVTAVRVRTLTSRLFSYVTTLELKRRDAADATTLLQSTDSAQRRMDSIVRALSEGGTVKEVSGAEIHIRPVPTAAARAFTDKLQAIWAPFQKCLLTLTNTGGEVDPLVVATAIRQAESNDPDYIKISDGLAQEENRYAEGLLGWLHLCRNACVTVVGLFPTLLLPLGFLLSRVNRANGVIESTAQELSAAKQDTDLIMQTVQSGLLLIDPDYIISGQHSAELERILKLDDPAGLNFLNILQRLLTEKNYLTAKDYFALLFNPNKREKLLADINPLSQVAVNFLNPEGGFLVRHLGFTFRRIVRNKVVERVFVGISDITAQVNLEKDLLDAEKRREKQFELLFGIIHVGAEPLDEFLRTAQADAQKINDALKAEEFIVASNQGRTEDLRARLNTAFASIHNIKGNAAYIHLGVFEKSAERFEDKISELLNQPTLAPDDFLSIVIFQSELRADLSDLADLRAKAGNLLSAGRSAPASAATPGAPQDEIITPLRSLAETVAGTLGKNVEINAADFAADQLPVPLRSLVKDVLIQLVRNSLAHSIETPAQRLLAGKLPAGQLGISGGFAEDGRWRLTYRDDGRGLDFKKIRARAIAQGLLPANGAQHYTDEQIAPLIFMPGFSTADAPTPAAGRGMGMEIIKEKIVDECDGEIQVRCEPARFCEFIFLLPVPEDAGPSNRVEQHLNGHLAAA